jgi:hypothetical protein
VSVQYCQINPVYLVGFIGDTSVLFTALLSQLYIRNCVLYKAHVNLVGGLILFSLNAVGVPLMMQRIHDETYTVYVNTHFKTVVFNGRII